MKVLFDTSVLLAAVVVSHPDHPVSNPWLQAAKLGRIRCCVGCHSLAEFYRVMTALPVNRAISGMDVLSAMQTDILSHAQIVDLGFADYETILQRMAQNNHRSGIIFDALIIQAALKAGVDKLLTLNSRHFERLWPNHTDQVIHPSTTQAP
jgi:predicted nucleic acid-binding protein